MLYKTAVADPILAAFPRFLYRFLAHGAWRSGLGVQNGDSVPLPTNVGLLPRRRSWKLLQCHGSSSQHCGSKLGLVRLGITYINSLHVM